MLKILISILFYETLFIENCQYYLEWFEPIFMFVNKVSDPAYAMSTLFPVVASVNTALASDIVVTTLVTEWLNTVLKWVFMEDRPFWWYKEAKAEGEMATRLEAIDLKLTSLTCETSPGSPSGHLMGSAAVLYALLRWTLANFVQRNPNLMDHHKKMLKLGLWGLVMGLLTLISLSRMYVAAHFLHQCVLGAVLGLMSGYVLTDHGPFCVQYWWRGASRKQLFLVTLIMFIITLLTCLVINVLGISPHWSVQLAFKWCNIPSYLNVFTSPLYSIVRALGAAFGLALASPMNLRSNVKFYPILGMVLVVGIMFSLHFIKDLIPETNIYIFYACQFSIFAAVPFLLLYIVPLVASLYKVKDE